MAEERDEAVEAIVAAVEGETPLLQCMEPEEYRATIRRAAAVGREPLLKRIEGLELAVAAARSRAKTAEALALDNASHFAALGVLTATPQEAIRAGFPQELAAAKAEGRREAFEAAAREVEGWPRFVDFATPREIADRLRALAKESR